jgi:hypothetical protein
LIEISIASSKEKSVKIRESNEATATSTGPESADACFKEYVRKIPLEVRNANVKFLLAIEHIDPSLIGVSIDRK